MIYILHFLLYMLTALDIFLFDKDRTLKKCAQFFEIDYTGGVLSAADSNLNQKPDSDHVDTIIRPIDSELEDILFSYQILTDGI
jgi:hypothetical protein